MQEQLLVSLRRRDGGMALLDLRDLAEEKRRSAVLENRARIRERRPRVTPQPDLGRCDVDEATTQLDPASEALEQGRGPAKLRESPAWLRLEQPVGPAEECRRGGAPCGQGGELRPFLADRRYVNYLGSPRVPPREGSSRVPNRREQAGAHGGFLPSEPEGRRPALERECAAAVGGLRQLGRADLRDVEAAARLAVGEDLDDATVEGDHRPCAQVYLEHLAVS